MIASGAEPAAVAMEMAMATHAPRQGFQTQQQVFAHAELGNDLPPLGHIANARPGAAVGGKAPAVTACQLNATAALGHQADDRLEQGGFANSIEPDQAGHLTWLDR